MQNIFVIYLQVLQSYTGLSVSLDCSLLKKTFRLEQSGRGKRRDTRSKNDDFVYDRMYPDESSG